MEQRIHNPGNSDKPRHVQVEAAGCAVTVEVGSEAETESFGRALAELVGPGTVLGLVGPLGAGKTRLARALAEGLGVDPGAIASPTFVLIHEYEGRLPVYHFDTYRLGGPEDFDALGAADYFAGSGLCLIEWADRVADRLPLNAWVLTLEPTGPTSRRLRLTFPAGPDLADRLARLLTAASPGDRLEP